MLLILHQEHFSYLFMRRWTLPWIIYYKKYHEYMRLKNCNVEYLLENGLIIDFKYKEENFIHLLGLHKLADLQLIQLFSKRNILSAE